MSIREEKKRETRKTLMNAALELIGRGENFAVLSLRDVAKTAGLVPTSFYRHFDTLESLGLAIVDELGLMLRRLIREARQASADPGQRIRASVEVYVRQVVSDPRLFTFMVQCRTGGTPALRDAIRNEMRYFANELAGDLRRGGELRQLSPADLDMVTALLVQTVADATVDILDFSVEDVLQREARIDLGVKQLRLIMLGASVWRSATPRS